MRSQESCQMPKAQYCTGLVLKTFDGVESTAWDPYTTRNTHQLWESNEEQPGSPLETIRQQTAPARW